MAPANPARKIRVLCVCPDLFVGGAAKQLQYFCQFADPTRLDISVVYYEGANVVDRLQEELGAPVTFLDKQTLGTCGLVMALRREIMARRPHILDCRMQSGYRFGRLAALGAGVPVIVAEQRSILKKLHIRRVLDLSANAWTDAWIANSNAVVNHIADYLHVPRYRIHLIYNGIDFRHFACSPKHPLLERLQSQGHRVVLNLGGLRAVKNQALFLKVCGRLRANFSELKFVICGEGQMRSSLETAIHHLGLGDSCHLLGYLRDVAPVLAASDLIIHTSDSESLPNALIEAMAAGVPIVSTDAGGTRELVQDGVNGLLAKVRGEDGLVTKASMILSDRDLANRLVAESSRRVRHSFSVHAMTNAYAQLFERLLARKMALCPKKGGENARSSWY
jgi:glycosyltransferase involved in cell wall biosynthesis